MLLNLSHIGQIGLAVSDVDRAEKFYETVMIGWEWLQREVDIFATFEVGHYRPKEQPNAVRIVHKKTGEEN
jgi:catechol-2,3-dioxygenase